MLLPLVWIDPSNCFFKIGSNESISSVYQWAGEKDGVSTRGSVELLDLSVDRAGNKDCARA